MLSKIRWISSVLAAYGFLFSIWKEQTRGRTLPGGAIVRQPEPPDVSRTPERQDRLPIALQLLYHNFPRKERQFSGFCTFSLHIFFFACKRLFQNGGVSGGRAETAPLKLRPICFRFPEIRRSRPVKRRPAVCCRPSGPRGGSAAGTAPEALPIRHVPWQKRQNNQNANHFLPPFLTIFTPFGNFTQPFPPP